MAEGEDHFETFLAIQQWLGRHQESDYLRATAGAPPPAGDAGNRALQAGYLDLLQRLDRGYTLGGAAGAPFVNQARSDMVGPIDKTAQAIADRGFLVVFDRIDDPRFAPIEPP